MKIRVLAALLMVALTLALAACKVVNIPIEGTLSANDLVNTAAAKTVSALGTDIASGRNETQAAAHETAKVPTVTLTRSPKPTVVVAKITPSPTPGPDCNRAEFLKDATIPDGSTILPNSVFTKTWELKNTGSCAWTTNYAVVFAGRGTAMSGPASTPVIRDGQVKPGETARVSVSLRAPGESGEYEGYWILRGGDGKTFGTGPGGAGPFYVKIRVAEEYSFAEHLCSAEWSSSAGKLPCPGKEGDSQGFVVPAKDPVMEDNNQHKGLGWLAMPQPVSGGTITGKFPAVIVPDHCDFRATISCAQGAEGCYTRFKVTYRIDNGEEQVLGEWNEGYEGGVTEAVKDLDMTTGRSTSFSFIIQVNGGTPERSKGIWFNPRIIKN
jgi:hypothetical protein